MVSSIPCRNILVTLLLLASGFACFAVPTISGNTSVCVGETATYNTSLSGLIYNWNATDGTVTGNTNTVSVQWDSAGVQMVTVVVTDANNMVTSGTLTVTVHAKPVPHITWPPYPTCGTDSSRAQQGSNGQHSSDPCVNVCKKSTITYSTPLHAGSTYQWLVPGSTSFTGQGTPTVTVNWDTTGTGSITVIETNAFGCVDSSVICINKIDIPVALFTNQNNVCLNSTVTFTNLPTGVATYQWFFGDGGTSNLFSPTHVYGTAGTYTITLVAMNACHCTDTFRRQIIVDAQPGPEIECPATICAGDTQTYTTNAPGCVYHWTVTGGTIISTPLNSPSITVAWGPGQLGHIYLYVTGCGSFCTDTTDVTIPIVPAVATITGPNKVCPGDCETYSVPQFMGGTYTWSISGTGSINMYDCCTAEVCWPATAFFSNDTLKVTYYDSLLGCGGSGQLAIHLRPQLALVAASPACSNGTTPVYANPAVNCNWTISPSGPGFTGNGTASIVIGWAGAVGSYVVTATPLVPNQVCTDSATTKVKVVAAPPKPVITGDTIVCPTNTYSYCATGTNVSWIITGGTPATGNGNCINITWGNSGPYIVKAIQQMTSSPNCPSDTATLLVYSALPISAPNITGPVTGCANGTSAFANTTIYPPGVVLNWSVGLSNSGSIISGQGTNNVTVQWGNNAPANDTVTLTVTLCNQTLISKKILNLFPAPTPVITVNGVFCPGVPVTLSATGGSYIAYAWSGPSFSSFTSPTSSVTQAGYYHVTVTDNNNCTGSAIKQVIGLPGPVASISTADPKTYCIGTPFSVTLSALTSPNYTYNWSNGNTTNPISVTTVGTYWVTVTDQNGCTSLSNSITISADTCHVSGPCTPNGTISFLHPTFYGCNPMSFTNTSVNGLSFTWYFGDGFTSNSTNAVHQYAQAGFYLVELDGYVPNSAGTDSCLERDTAHIEVPLAPKFKSVAGCAKDSVCFTDLSTYTPGNNITSWLWNFGDASPNSTSQNPCHKYAVGGIYTVTLTISNGTCSSSFVDTVVVLPQPVAAFNFNSPSCVNSNTLFTDASTPAIGINYWSWTFGDAGTSLNQNPNHSYNTPGVYGVQLVVSNSFGCRDTANNNITIVAPNIPGAITPYPDTIVCAKNNVLLVAPTCAGCTYIWSNGGTNDSTTVSATGLYTLTITNANGCKAALSIHITIVPGPATSIINYGADKFCLGGSTYLTALYFSNYLYYWISNDLTVNGSVATGVAVQPATPGVYYYTLAITDTITGCADTSLPYYITVNDTPATPTITAVGPTTVCAGDTIILVVHHPDTTVAVHWNTGDVSDTIFVTASGCYTAQIVDSNGCDKSATKCVTVNPLPPICSFWTGCLDTCRPYIIHGPVGNSSYQWLLNGVPISGATLPDYAATQNGAYSLILTNSFGCTDTTGVLNLTMHDCDTCAHLITDTVYCDQNGNVIYKYQIVNHSGYNINQSNLLVLSPNLNTIYSPVTYLDTIHTGDTSHVHTAVIYGGNTENHLCFMIHVQQIDDNGDEVFCCNTDTACFHMPCDSTPPCCYLNILSDSVWCTGTNSSGIQTYGFQALVSGCGNLQLITPDGIITTNTNYTLTPGNTLLSGTFVDNPPVTGTFCLGFILRNNNIVCHDTTVCMALPHCDSSCCYLHILRDTVVCKGIDTSGHHIYSFTVKLDGCGNLLLQTSGGTITSTTSFVLTPGSTIINGTFIDYPSPNGMFCLTFTMVSGNVICADTTVCIPLPHCDSLPVLPECYLKLADTICAGQTTTAQYTGSATGHTFNWIFTGGVPSSATGPGPHNITYNTPGCYPVQLNIITGNQTSICYDTICVVAAPVASITQSGSNMFAYPAGMNYQWYTGAPNWAPVTGQNNQFYNPGISGLYCVVVSNNYGCRDTACRDYQETGISSVNQDFSWSIVPNPNNGNFELVVQSSVGGRIKFSITNTIGELIREIEIDAVANETRRIPVTEHVAGGIYFIKMESNKQVGVQKVFIK